MAKDALASLQAILNGYVQRPADARRALEEWNRSNRAELVSAGVLHLGCSLVRIAERELAHFLAIYGAYMKYLLHPVLLTEPEAIRAATLLCKEDIRFFPRLIAACEEDNRPDVVMRGLDIVVALNRAAVVVPWLQELTRHPDPHVQSKAALVFCRLYANPTLVARQLQSPDNRVRANAVEALWGMDTVSNRTILETAGRDKHHRVAVNALMGLYLLHVPWAADRLLELAGNDSPEFRAAAAWAMGRTGDELFRDHLEALLDDPAEPVRRAAHTALEHLPTSERLVPHL